MARVYRNTNDVAAHLPGVRAAVSAELEGRAARVRAVVQAHRRTGRLAGGTDVRVGRTDAVVFISHPAVHAINYGHRDRGGGWVEGIHAIEAAL